MNPARSLRLSTLAGLALATATAVHAQQTVIPLWAGAAPGSAHWTRKETVVRGTPVGTVAINVVRPTLTVFLPDSAHATGTGVIIAPGGYCIALALDAGTDLARWLQGHGIAAFVLSYRTQKKTQPGVPRDLDMDKACRWGIADGKQALKVVREHAKPWGLAPHRVGFVGYSAGGMVASALLLQPDVAARPDFVALIYGAPFGAMPAIPHGLPPIFMAWARDDDLAGPTVAAFYRALVAAGDPPEAHIYRNGGHGFGMRPQHTSSDRWPLDFLGWLRSHGLADRPPR